MSDDPLINGIPISSLKVVDLRKELEERGLAKSGNKKDLFERLRAYLNEHDDGIEQEEVEDEPEEEIEQEPETVEAPEPVEPPAEAVGLGSPTPSAQQVAAAAASGRAASPTKGPMNKLVAQYLEKQQAALQEARRDAELVRGTEEKEPKTDDDTEDDRVKSPEKVGEPEVVVTEKEDNTTAEIADNESPVKPVTPAKEEEPIITSSGDSKNVEFEEEKQEPEAITVEEPEKEASAEADLDTTQTSEDTEEQASSGSSDSSDEEPAKETADSGEESADEAQDTEENAIELDYGEDVDAEKSPVKQLETTEPSASPKKNEENGAPVEESSVTSDKKAEEGEEKDVKTDETVATPSSTAPVDRFGFLKQFEEPKEERTKTAYGLIRAREVSPARHPPSQYIHIHQLKRPFTIKSLHTLLAQFGEFDKEEFWMDGIKSNCIVKFGTTEDAEKARNELHNVIWPDCNDRCLFVEYSSEEKLKRRRGEVPPVSTPNNNVSNNTISSSSATGIKVILQSEVENSPNGLSGADDEKKGSEEDVITVRSDESSRKVVKERPAAPPRKDLDLLFKKTNAKPFLYYLPLTDEEVAKKELEKKSEKEEREKARLERHKRQSSRTPPIRPGAIPSSNPRRPSRSPPRRRGGISRSPDRKRERRSSPPRSRR